MRAIPTITKNLLIINVLAYLATYVFESQGVNLNHILGLYYFETSYFHFFQLITYMFMHANIEHLFFNMFALWMFGCVVERVWGAKRFLIYYMVCGIGAGLLQEGAQFMAWHMAGSLPGLTVGASGAVYGILLAFGMTFPEERIFIFPLPIPIKAKWFVCIYAVIELGSALLTSGDGIAHLAHLGGMLFGYILIKYWQNGGKAGMNIEMPHFFKKRHKVNSSAKDERNKDWEYNQRQNTREEEIDKILDKVRRNGYDCLTEEEKKRLFRK